MTGKADAEGAPKVRLVKGGSRHKSGIVEVEDERGVSFRCPCDECGQVVATKSKPVGGRDFVCETCRLIRRKGKPSTRWRQTHTGVRYITQCDKCGKEQETPFLPKNDRGFLCGGCMRKEPQRDKRPLKKGVEVLGDKKDPLYLVPCDHCRKKVQVKFVPRRDEPFVCQGCFDQKRERRRNDIPDTRAFFMIECVKCGRKEMVDFTPNKLGEARCSRCFHNKTGRR